MKIAVYTICKNEAQFVRRWLDSAKDADVLLVTDTGSSDNTYPLLNTYAKTNDKIIVNQVKIAPWRFDDARQFSLLTIPDDIDICICLDMDEVLVEGWRELVEKAYNTPSLDRLRYNYVWSWNEDASPAVTYYADKIHKRHGYRWVNPVHEVLSKDARLGPEIQSFINETLIEHYPDLTKNRSSYLGLLELAVKENPWNDRNAHYYARELMFDGQHDKAIKEFYRHIGLPTAKWDAEKAASWRYLGDCHWALEEYELASNCFRKAIQIAPNEREPYIALAQALRYSKDWEGVIENCEKALAIKEKPNSYICQPSAWSNWPDQMLNEARTMIGEKHD